MRCNKCGRDGLDPTDFYLDRSRPSGRHSTCAECVRRRVYQHRLDNPGRHLEAYRRWYARDGGASQRAKYRALRARVIEEYGGACACCGETTPEFLAIDHVNNDGEAHRRELKGYGRSIYQWLKNEGFPRDGRFQLLCHNCNSAKGYYGTCPHQRSRAEVA